MLKFKQLSLSLLLIAVFASCTSVAKQPLEGGWLWKISGNGLSQPSYLFGTYHGTYNILYGYVDSIPGFHEAFNACSQYVGEVSLTNGSKPDISAMDMKMPKDTTYADLLNEEDYHFLDSIVRQNFNASLNEMYLKPDYLSILLGQLEERKELINSGYSKEQIDSITSLVMDVNLEKKAKEKGDTIIGLESVSEQMKMLGSEESLKKQATQLIKVLRKDDEYTLFSSHAKTLTEVYHAQDMKCLLDYETKLDSIFNIFPELATVKKGIREDLLKRRNMNWMDKLPELMKDKPTFIAVGVRHLPGKDGLITLLREKGYKVESIRL